MPTRRMRSAEDRARIDQIVAEGREYWKSRLHSHGETLGRATKRLTHRLESWSSQDLVDSLSARLVSRFELLRAQPAQMAVAA